MVVEGVLYAEARAVPPCVLASTVGAGVQVRAAGASKTSAFVIENEAGLLLLIPRGVGRGSSVRRVWPGACGLSRDRLPAMRARGIQMAKASTPVAGQGQRGCHRGG